MTIVLDIGGEGSIWKRPALVVRPEHPVWGHATWFTLNIDRTKDPDVVDDATTLSRVKDSSVNGLYSSHTIEHIAPEFSATMFANWFRVLKPGGRLEIRCPDVEWTWREYFAGRLPEAIVTELVLGIKTGPYEVHRNLWWASKLIGELLSAGFVAVRRIDYGFVHPYLDFWPYDGRFVEYHGFKVVDLLVEAYKPPVETSSTVLDPTMPGFSGGRSLTARHLALRFPLRGKNFVTGVLTRLRKRGAAKELRRILVR